MRIIFIRHAEPDYAIDGLTEKGKREADLLSKKMAGEKIDKIYVSSMGRARLTAKPIEEIKGMKAEICDWLREFGPADVSVPYSDTRLCNWDLLPGFVNDNPALYDINNWQNVDFIKNSPVPQTYNMACTALDSLLAEHGYVREGVNYRAVSPNHDTLVLVCHYAITCALLSHLLNCSPYTLWQNFVIPPSGVTTVFTEERIEGLASFRACGFGDVSHLYKYGEEPSFAARFCECFKDDTRH